MKPYTKSKVTPEELARGCDLKELIRMADLAEKAVSTMTRFDLFDEELYRLWMVAELAIAYKELT